MRRARTAEDAAITFRELGAGFAAFSAETGGVAGKVSGDIQITNEHAAKMFADRFFRLNDIG